MRRYEGGRERSGAGAQRGRLGHAWPRGGEVRGGKECGGAARRDGGRMRHGAGWRHPPAGWRDSGAGLFAGWRTRPPTQGARRGRTAARAGCGAGESPETEPRPGPHRGMPTARTGAQTAPSTPRRRYGPRTECRNALPTPRTYARQGGAPAERSDRPTELRRARSLPPLPLGVSILSESLKNLNIQAFRRNKTAPPHHRTTEPPNFAPALDP